MPQNRNVNLDDDKKRYEEEMYEEEMYRDEIRDEGSKGGKVGGEDTYMDEEDDEEGFLDDLDLDLGQSDGYI